MKPTTIARLLGATLILTLSLVPMAMAQTTDGTATNQPAAVVDMDSGLVEQLGIDARPSAELTSDELQARIDKLVVALDQGNLKNRAKRQVRALLEADRNALEQRQAEAAAQPAEPSGESGASTDAVTEPPPAVPEPVADAEVEQPAPATIEQPATATDSNQSTTDQSTTDAAATQPVASPSVDAPPEISAAAEAQAATLLADETPGATLSDDALKARVDRYRELLDEPELSRKTAKALRQRLKTDRDVLRARIAQQEAAAQAQADQAAAAQQPQDIQQQPSSDQTAQQDQQVSVAQPAAAAPAALQETLPIVIAPTAQEIPLILEDHRPAKALADEDLNRRILATRDARQFDEYSQDDLTLFDQQLRADRLELNNRLLAERAERADAYQQFDDPRVEINLAPEIGEAEALAYVFAAEVDDEEMWDQLVSAPIEPLERRYSRHDVVEEPDIVMNMPEVREAMPSIELDTITFGFNEAFVREEEIFDLDRIARMIERIVAHHPDEVFMIEGHTDAVGSDAYNLRLSRQRAQAVKEALTRYYLISPYNLATVGLGERYLKIWTPEPEEENRRVTVRRVTPLISGYDPQEE